MKLINLQYNKETNNYSSDIANVETIKYDSSFILCSSWFHTLEKEVYYVDLRGSEDDDKGVLVNLSMIES